MQESLLRIFDADTVDVSYTEVKTETKTATQKAREAMEKARAKREAAEQKSSAAEGMQPNINFDNMTDEQIEATWQEGAAQ